MFTPLEEYLNSINLAEDQALSLFVRNLDTNDTYQFNENQKFYPASLIKLFAAFRAKDILQNPGLDLDEFSINDLNVAMKNSLDESDNDALSLVYDFISDSYSGLYKKENFGDFVKARNSITEYFRGIGFSEELALHNKCYSFAPYGKDLKLFLEQGSNQILLSDAQKIITLIVEKKPELLEFMHRDGSCKQSEFIYQGLNKQNLDFFYSKAGWTTSVRHDVAYFSIKGRKYVFVILTKGLSGKEDLIPKLVSLVDFD